MPASIRAKVPVNCIDTVEKHCAGWKAQKSRTASDGSTIGFEYYKTAIFVEELTINCNVINNIVLRRFCVRGRWGLG